MSRAYCIVAFLLLIAFYPGRVSSQTNNSSSQSATTSAAAKEPLRRVTLVNTAPSAEAKQFYEEGLKLSEAGQFPQAVEKFREAIKNDTEYADAYAALGRTYFKLRQWQSAIDNLRRAAALSANQREEQDALHRKLVAKSYDRPLDQVTNSSSSSKIAEPKRKNVSTPPLVNHVHSLPAAGLQKFIAIKVSSPVSASNPPLPEPPKSVAVDKKASPPAAEAVKSKDETQPASGARVSMNLATAPQPLDTKTVAPVAVTPPIENLALTKIYRVGPGDVIDVRLNDSQSSASTLFTITPAGFLEHPALADPLPVTGLTVDEIAAKLEDDLKRRAIVENPRAIVGVRDYTSHTVLVSGLVKESGTKFLRREAIPLYVVVADAQPLPEAAKVSVVRNESNEIYEIDLAQPAEMNLLVRPGDVITLQPNETQFIYIGGEVRLPGEKTFRRGLTLTQAIITAGGVVPKAKVVQIDRDDGRGFLVGTCFNLKDISSGKTIDPLLKPGDRITVAR